VPIRHAEKREKYRKHAGPVRRAVRVDYSLPQRDRPPSPDPLPPSRWERAIAAVKELRARFARLTDGLREQYAAVKSHR
jgi:hypothetical protein